MSLTIRTASLAALLAAPGAIRAQTIGGQVIDPATRRPARAAGVALLNDSARFAATARVDAASGVFYLDAPRAGTFQVVLFDRRGRASVSASMKLDADSTVERAFPFASPDGDSVASEALYFAGEVATPAALRATGQSPAFPEQMRRRRQPGLVALSFVVDTTGRIDAETVTVVASTHADFTDAVRKVLPKLQFHPAELNGRHVRQIQQLSFGFVFPGIDLPADVMIMALGGRR